MARTTDARSRSQSMGRDTHRGTYIITHVQPIEVKVKQVRARKQRLDGKLCHLKRSSEF